MKLKRISILFTLMLILSTIFTSFAFADENLDKPKLVALGDSITFGYKLEDNQTTASPNAFPNLIAPGELDITNLGYPGWTSSDLKQSLEKNPAFTIAVQSADFVTLDIGSNDLLGAVNITEIINSPTPPNMIDLLPKVQDAAKQLKENLEFIITMIQTENPATPIFLYNIYNPFGESTDPKFAALHTIGEILVHEGLEIPGVGSLPGINQLFAQFDQIPGIYLADAYSAYDKHQSEYIFGAPKDLIHPNAAGHQALATLSTNLLATFLSEEVPFTLTAVPSEETTGPVTIEVALSNTLIIDSMRWLEEAQTVDGFFDEDGLPIGEIINENKFQVTENGTYSIYVVDKYGRESVQEILIDTITPPIEEPPVENPDPTPTTPEPEPTKPEPTKPEPKPITPKPTPSTPGTGNPLPNTASPVYNYLAIGSALVLAGYVAMNVQNRRRKKV